jgi:hypothetical protein
LPETGKIVAAEVAKAGLAAPIDVTHRHAIKWEFGDEPHVGE